MDQRLHTPGRPFEAQATDEPVERHRMMKRLFTASDVQTTAATRSLTYYLTPDSDGPSKHASDGLVVASRDDGAYVYELELAAVDAGFERWGKLDVPGQSCARWTRPRDGEATISTYAVIRDAVGMWTFSVGMGANRDVCFFQLDHPSLDAKPPMVTHLVVSVDNSNPAPHRTSFVIGFEPRADVGCNAPTEIDPPVSAANPTCS